MAHLLVLVALMQQLTTESFDPESPVLPQGVTCAEAWTLESTTGGKLKHEGPYDPHRIPVFDRTYLGREATVIYLCNSESVDWRIITVPLNSIDEVQSLATQHTKLMTDRFGAPCWDPNNLSNEQRGLLPEGVPAANLRSRRTVWNIRPGVVGAITLPTTPNKLGNWMVIIESGLPPEEMESKDPVESAWKLSTCARSS